ncbi:MAG TPA: STAS domain-containing protein [Gallionella sp.]|nr:STAS domain-containing protein [Gallionella sp.]
MTGQEGEWMVVSGNLNIETVPALFETGLRHLAGDNLNVDFSRVTSVDSAAVSMLLGWARAAQRVRQELRVRALPQDLLNLARLYGVAELLPQQSD